MFGFGKKKSGKTDDHDERFTKGSDDAAVRGYFGSAKDESDKRAARGEGPQ